MAGKKKYSDFVDYDEFDKETVKYLGMVDMFLNNSAEDNHDFATRSICVEEVIQRLQNIVKNS